MYKRQPLSALTISSYVIDTVTSDNNAIYIVNKDNAIIAYRQQTMQPEWVTDFNAPIVKIVNTDSYLCVESTDKTLTCLHKSSGKRAWETYMKQTAFMTIHNQALYCAVDNVLYTFSVSSGELISKIQYPDALIGFQKNHNTLILNSEQGLLYTLDL